MQVPLPHHQETQRMEKPRRYHIIDTAQEPAFAEITQLLAEICETPLGVISLVDTEQQGVKYNKKIYIPFCRYTMQQEAVFIIPDISKDDRFNKQPFFINNSAIKFYAGVPIITLGGTIIGSLCVMDYTHRELNPIQIKTLKSLGIQTRNLLESRQQIINNQTQTEQLQQLVNESNDLIQIINITEKKIIYTNQNWQKTIGYQPNEIQQISWQDIIHPEYYEYWQKILEQLQTEKSIDKIEIILLSKTGEFIWVEGQLSQPQENPNIIKGIFRNITTEKQAEFAYQKIFENANEGLFQATIDGHYQKVNPALAKIYGYDSPREFLDNVDNINQPYLDKKLWDECQILLQTEGEVNQKIEVNRKDDTTIWIVKKIRWQRNTKGEAIGIEGSIQDLSAHKQAEATLKLAKDQLQAVLDAVPGTVSLISSSFRYLGVNCHLAANYQMPPEAFVGRKVGFLQPEFGEFMREFFANPAQESSLEINTEVEGLTRNYLVIAKKWLDGKAAVFVGMDITERKQAQEALQAELSEAAEYVRSLLPQPLQEPLVIDSRFIPSQQLGGDSFDYYWLDDEHLVLYLLDVSGHGTGPALLSVSVLNLLRSRSLPNTNFYKPNEVLSALNQAFQLDNQRNMYFTIWYGVYHHTKRHLIYASAGHPPAILLTQNTGKRRKQIRRLRTAGLPIGMFPNVEFFNSRCDIKPNSTLYLYSDGAYEIQKPDGQIWGLKDFIKLLQEYQEVKEFTLDDILQHLRRLRGKDSFNDDLSLLKVNFS